MASRGNIAQHRPALHPAPGQPPPTALPLPSPSAPYLPGGFSPSPPAPAPLNPAVPSPAGGGRRAAGDLR